MDDTLKNELMFRLLIESENLFVRDRHDEFTDYKKLEAMTSDERQAFGIEMMAEYHDAFLKQVGITEEEYVETIEKHAGHTPIFFIAENIDGWFDCYKLDSVAEVYEDWMSDHCTLPANDDLIIFARVYGKQVKCGDFLDLLAELGIQEAIGMQREFALL